jgi:hypothetical protein
MPSNTRLLASGLPPGAVITSGEAQTVSRFPTAKPDLRVKISDPSGKISRAGGPLAPLSRTDYKVVFPYTPEISINHVANYNSVNPTHSNYEYNFYQNSTVSEITINAQFSAQTPEDAEYVLAVQHFFRSVTKMFSGNDVLAGLPPVVCKLEGHGSLQLNYVPVVITGFSVSLPSDVDYITCPPRSNQDKPSRVPVLQTFNITTKPTYSRQRLGLVFGVDRFANGELLGTQNGRAGGFI